MAFPSKVDFDFNHVGQPPYPQQTTLQTEENLDARAIENLTYINSIIAAYASSTAGDSGSKYMGIESIVGIAGNDLQTVLVSIKAILDGMVLGAIPPGSIGVDQLNFDPATQAELDAVSALVTAITSSLATTNSTMTTHKADYVRQPGYGTSGGTANAYTLTLVPPLASLVDGASAYINFNANNTGASTLNWDGTGVHSIVDLKGSALIKDKILANGIRGVRYNASTGNFQLQGEGGDYGTATASTVKTGYSIGTDSGLVNGTLDLSLLVTGNLKAGITIDGVTGKTSVVDTSDANAIASQLLAGLYMYVNGLKITGIMPNKAWQQVMGTIVNAGTAGTVYINAPEGYFFNSQLYMSDPNYIASNILNTASIFGLVGTAINAKVITAGENVVNSNTSLVYLAPTSSTPTKAKETQIIGVSGTIRVSFDFASTQTYDYVHAQIYKNGVAVGTLRSSNITSYVTYTEDISFVAGDLIQIWGTPVSALCGVNIQNFLLSWTPTAITFSNNL